MAFCFFYRISVTGKLPVCLHADTPKDAIAYLLQDGYSTTDIQRIEQKESGKDAPWQTVYRSKACA